MKRRMLSSLASGLTIALLAVLFSLTYAADRLENQYALGLLYALRQPVKPPQGAVVIAIDAQTLAWLRDREATPEKARLIACLPPSAAADLDRIRGPGSLPRSVHGCLLAELKRLGVSVAVFDILFAVAGDGEDDEKFAESLARHGPAALLVGFERSMVRDGASEFVIEREVKPFALFQRNAGGIGTFIVSRSGGPVYAYLPRLPGFPDTRSLPEQALILLGKSAVAERAASATARLRYFWLYGPPGSIETISARDILRGDGVDFPSAKAASLVAFIGASDPATTNYPDSFPSFFRGGSEANISGVELAATAYLNLLHGEIAWRVSPWVSPWLVAGFAAVLGFLAWAKPPRAIVAISVAALVYLGLAAFAFARHGLFPPLATPVFFVAPVALLLAIVIRYRFARALIMHLVPAPMARRMLTKTSDERGATISEEATVVFFDLIGSTAIAEKIEPLAFASLINAYHETVTRQVGKHGGFVSSFTGDGAIAVFTSTDAGRDHAPRACRAVLAAIGDLRAVNAANRERGLPALAMRVGVNSGTVAEGEMGAHDRFNFAVSGDVVNLAARLEQMGKTRFPGEIDVVLVGQATRAMVDAPDLVFANCGAHPIRGREKPEEVHRLLVA
jgi:adenylate cyclase